MLFLFKGIPLMYPYKQTDRSVLGFSRICSGGVTSSMRSAKNLEEEKRKQKQRQNYEAGLDFFF